MSARSDTAQRFTGRVDDYERYRPRYPVELIALLQRRCGLLATDLVADIGAGTGMLAELFLANGNAVIGVEPNAEMRASCARLQLRYPGLTLVDGTAEATTLQEASVDFISAGRAFHWFDPELTRREFSRILRPGGWVVLVTLRRGRRDTAQEEAYEQILLDHGVDYREVLEGYRAYDQAEQFFTGGTTIRESIDRQQAVTLEELLGQTQSLSVAPMPGHPKYDGMQHALCEHFAQFAEGGLLHVATSCYLTCIQIAPGDSRSKHRRD